MTNKQQPKLTLEIVSRVLGNVPRATLLSALRVNSTFKDAALPLLYRHFYFEPKRPEKCGQMKEDLLRCIEVLDVFDHDAEDCANLKLSHSPKVVRIHFDKAIPSLHSWHGDTKCPLLSLKPETVVFVDFTAKVAPPDPKKAAKTCLYPDAKHRAVLWDVSRDFDSHGFTQVKGIIFPPKKDDMGLKQRVTAIRKGTGGLPSPDDLTRSEVVIFSNSTGGNTYDPGFWSWFKSWIRSHTRRKHVLVNLQALKPGNEWFIDSTEESLWEWCAYIAEELELPREDGYDKMQPLAYSHWPRIEEYRRETSKFLTETEIDSLLPPKKAKKAATAKKGTKSKSKTL